MKTYTLVNSIQKVRALSAEIQSANDEQILAANMIIERGQTGAVGHLKCRIHGRRLNGTQADVDYWSRVLDFVLGGE